MVGQSRRVWRQLDLYPYFPCGAWYVDYGQHSGFDSARLRSVSLYFAQSYLSCLAALQAPVILMGQKRQDAKDRLRSQNDYRINLKAELEIRHLHEKIDHLISRQWQRLARTVIA